jgi:hypothetical protein
MTVPSSVMPSSLAGRLNSLKRLRIAEPGVPMGAQDRPNNLALLRDYQQIACSGVLLGGKNGVDEEFDRAAVSPQGGLDCLPDAPSGLANRGFASVDGLA